MHTKIGIIGAGKVGTEAANEITRMNIADCILFDVESRMASGKALDLTHSTPIRHSSSTVSGAGSYADLKQCEVVVITAGMPRTAGMSRDDLLDVNAKIISEVAEQVQRYAPQSIKIVVTNPVDTMTYLVWKLTGRDDTRTIGMAGLLDSTRFRALLAMKLNISAEDIHALVIGTHGDCMIPLTRYASAGGVPVNQLIDDQSLRQIEIRTREAGTEIVGLLKAGSAYYAAGTAIAIMVDSIINDKRKVICSSVMCKSMYGINGVFIGLPMLLGKKGVEQILPLELNAEEWHALMKAADHNLTMQNLVDTLGS